MKIWKSLFLISGVLFLAGNAYAATAIAELQPTKADSRLKGQAKFTEEKTGVVVRVEVWNAPPGKLGLHIHEKGVCTNEGNDAGGHYNPSGNPHGYSPKDYPLHAHPGDMGNIEVDVDGHGTLKLHMPDLGLASRARYDIRGLAVILHEKEDDFSQPTGNAGGRIACGVITEA